jgi:hypothetical protein
MGPGQGILVVTELPIEDALVRARQRFQQADERLSGALTGTATRLPVGGDGVCYTPPHHGPCEPRPRPISRNAFAMYRAVVVSPAP